MEYKSAINIDKRTYFQYYWSLLKKKVLLFFTFYPTLDYNLMTIKICLFLISFSLYLTINALFFSDKALHDIHKNNGIYKIILEIPKIIYSSIISITINKILQLLSLSEKNFLEYKNIHNSRKMKRIANMKKVYEKKLLMTLKIKYIVFFILSYILLFFFWYFISCFCAVYINTQETLIKDTFISFCLSMLYPFGLSLLPGFFRFPALKAPKKDKET